MSLRGFFLWFWGIVLGSGVAAGAALALLKAPEPPPAPPPVQPVAAAVPLPLPPVPFLPAPAPREHAASWRPAHPTVIRPALRLHETRRLAQRITVVPPLPPEPEAVRPPEERHVRLARLASARRTARVETRTRIVREQAPPEPRTRLYTYEPSYPRYSYDSYSYEYLQPYYPYRFSYYYRY